MDTDENWIINVELLMEEETEETDIIAIRSHDLF
jgi:hypothetical protein